MSFKPNTITVHYGELALKGKNQPDFINRLRDNLRYKLRGLNLDWKVIKAHSYIYISIPEQYQESLEPVLQSLGELAGIAWIAPAQFFKARSIKMLSEDMDFSPVNQAVTSLAEQEHIPEATFAVRVNRGEKRFAKKSPEVARELGTQIIQNTPWQSVDLNNPDKEIHVDIYVEGVFVYSEKQTGIGGLPNGITGRVLTLLSGGIDSPVAAFLAAKRGCSVDFIHFTANRLQQEQAEEYKISHLVRDLSRYTMRSKLYLVPYTHFEFQVMGDSMEYELMLFRRFMVRTAEALATPKNLQALVTGDNLAQVASQTLENITSNARAVDIPILQPLLTYDKHEIVNLAKKIGTYSLSLEPYKDCCSILSRHPKTISTHEQLQHMEDEIFPDYEALIRETLEDALILEYDNGEKIVR